MKYTASGLIPKFSATVAKGSVIEAMIAFGVMNTFKITPITHIVIKTKAALLLVKYGIKISHKICPIFKSAATFPMVKQAARKMTNP